ncbi:MAG: hypothetical protein IKM66_02010 [Clostridia bacterium]|nr:hypothetical protein [Clostridia bacterium]
MRYYKKTDENGNVVLIATTTELTDASLTEISEEEYSELDYCEEIADIPNDDISEQSKDERIAELEKENAALLFQILTGEEYADV